MPGGDLVGLRLRAMITPQVQGASSCRRAANPPHLYPLVCEGLEGVGNLTASRPPSKSGGSPYLNPQA